MSNKQKDEIFVWTCIILLSLASAVSLIVYFSEHDHIPTIF